MTGRTSDTRATSRSGSAPTGPERCAGSAALAREPYRHALIDGFLDEDIAARILDWLEKQGSWAVEHTGLYEQHRCVNLLDLLFADSTCTSAMLLGSADRLEEVFRRPMERRRIEVSAHKLVEGQYIRTHTDVPHGLTETHRAVISLASPTPPVTGGELMLQRSQFSSDDAVRVRPVHNRAALMELSDRSFHSVLPVRSGIRYSLVLSYWAADAREGLRRGRDAGALPGHLRQFMERIGAHEVPHAGRRAATSGRLRPLSDHLLGTHAILKSWGCDPDVCTAGLFHGIYGPLGLGTALLPPDARATLREVIGAKAEQLVHLYTTLDRRTDRPTSGGRFTARILGEPAAAHLDGSTAAGVFLISWASLREQVPDVEVSGAEMDEILGRLELFGPLVPSRAAADLRATFCP